VTVKLNPGSTVAAPLSRVPLWRPAQDSSRGRRDATFRDFCPGYKSQLDLLNCARTWGPTFLPRAPRPVNLAWLAADTMPLNQSTAFNRYFDRFI